MMQTAAPTDLTGKIALVTGASGGIGAAAVAHFAALGAVVYATDIGTDFDGPATYRAFDLSDNDSLAALSDQSAYMTAQTIGVDGGNVLR